MKRAPVLIAYSCLFFLGAYLTQAQRTFQGAHISTKPAPGSATMRPVEAYGKLPLSFEVNRGQTGEQVRFLSRGSSYVLFLTPGEVVLRLSAADKDGGAAHRLRRTELRMTLPGGNPSPQMAGLEELPGRSNYFIGNDPKQWRTNIPSYAKVKYHNVYPGVDLIFYGNQRQLEYDLVVAPGADPKAIRLDIQGAGRLSLDAQGDVVMGTAGGDVQLHRPRVYQSVNDRLRREIDGRFVMRGGNQLGFELAAYDAARPLVIDPVLTYSTYLGGSGQDSGNAIAVDSSGNAYVTGSTSSPNFPTALPLQASRGGASNTNVFVAKLNPSGTALVYSTYLGGSGQDQGNGIAVDSSGDAYVTGSAQSSDFPTTSGAVQSVFGGAGDAFVTELNSVGSALVYSTYLGGSGQDQANGIAVNSSGSAFVTGFTQSGNFPVASALQPALSGSRNSFVAKLNAAGSALAYSTYLGGTGVDQGNGIAVDSSGNAYVTGSTQSSNFPTTAGAAQTVYGGAGDAFIAKLNAAGSALAYSTFLGGSLQDVGSGIAVDSSGNAYATGFAQSSNFPVTASFQAALSGFINSFVAKLNPAGTSLVYSTYLGGAGDDRGDGIAVDSSGNVYVAGLTNSTNFPITSGAFKTVLAGGTEAPNDAFVAKFNSTGTALVYSSYLGGTGEDQANGIAVDASGNVYVTGTTSSTDFPTSGPIQAASGGGQDAFVAQISATNPLPILTTLSPSSAIVGGAGFTLTVNGSNFVAGAMVQWNGANLSTTFVSSSQLSASIPSGDIATAGTAQVTVFDPSPGGGSSNALTFTIVVTGGNLVPTISSLSPPSATSGSAGFTLTVTGANFVSGSQLLWNGSGRTTTFVSSTQLDASIPASDVAAFGTAQVTVSSPAPGGGTSNGLTFAIVNPLPTLTGMSPANATAGGTQFVLTVTGTGFFATSVVNWNGIAVTTTFVSSTQLTATIPSSDIAAAGTASVTVTNPAPNGGTSSALTFSIVSPGNNPVPMIISVSPSSTIAGGPAFTVTVNGLNFLASSAVLWNGINVATTFVSSTQLSAVIPASDISASGTALILVFNPAPGGGSSNAFTFTINPPGFNPVPVISSLSPSSAVAGSGGFTLTVTGSNFVASSVVLWNGSVLATSFASATQLQTSIPASDVALATTAQVTVINPAPGGGTSSPASFAITSVTGNPVPVLTALSPSSVAAGGAGFTLTVNGSSFVAGAVVEWNASMLTTTFVSGSQLAASVPSSDIAAVGTASVTVLNPAPGGGVSNALTLTVTTFPIINPGGTVNGASYSNQPLAPASIASVFGGNYTSSTINASVIPLPMTLGGATLLVNGIPAPLFAVTPQQINFQIPSELAGQTQATVLVTANNGTSNTVTINLAGFNPGLFATNMQGSGQGAILTANTAFLAAPLGAFPGSSPAVRGGFISIFCTGLGPVTNQPADGATASATLLSTTTTTPTVTIGGNPATVSFSGLAPGFVGLYQVNVQVPDSVSPGNAVPVILNIGGVTSNTVTIAVQ